MRSKSDAGFRLLIVSLCLEDHDEIHLMDAPS